MMILSQIGQGPDDVASVCQRAFDADDPRLLDAVAVAVELLDRAANTSPVFAVAARNQADRLVRLLEVPGTGTALCAELASTVDALQSIPQVDAAPLIARIDELARPAGGHTRTNYLKGAAIAGGILVGAAALLLSIDYFRPRSQRRRR